MILKLFGAFIIILATTCAGYLKAKTVADRPKQIQELRSFLSLLETEIGYGTKPIIQACQHICHGQTGPIALLFKTFIKNLNQMDGASTYECFCQAIENEWGKTALAASEKKIFLDFSRTLGISNREDQLHHLSLTAENLKIEERKARDDQVKYEKMYKTLGFLSGTLIVILMF